MRKFIARSSILLIPSLILYLVFIVFLFPRLLELRYGPSTASQIQTSFKNATGQKYDLLVLGNSRLYRGVNPDRFSIPTFNFAHDQDSYNQMYYKLMYLQSKKIHPRILIVGIDVFQFAFLSESRNYVYEDFLGSDYLKDYPPKCYKFNYYASLRIDKLFERKKLGFLKSNGQYVNSSPAVVNLMREDVTRLPVQVTYFEKIIQEMSDDNIFIFLVMAPATDKARQKYSPTTMSDFESFINQHLSVNVTSLNYYADDRFETRDFIDPTHLNEQGADKFSKILSADIDRILASRQIRP